MSKETFADSSKTPYKSLCDLNLLGLYSGCGSEWSSITKEEIQTGINQSIEEDKPNSKNNVVLFGALTVLALLSVAAWIQTPKINQAVQEAGRSSVEQLILTGY